MKPILLVCLLIPFCCAAADNWPPTYGTMGYTQEVIGQKVTDMYDDDAMVWSIDANPSILKDHILYVNIIISGNLTSDGLSDIKEAVGEAMKDIDSQYPDIFNAADVTIRRVVFIEEYPVDFVLEKSWT